MAKKNLDQVRSVWLRLYWPRIPDPCPSYWDNVCKYTGFFWTAPLIGKTCHMRLSLCFARVGVVRIGKIQISKEYLFSTISDKAKHQQDIIFPPILLWKIHSGGSSFNTPCFTLKQSVDNIQQDFSALKKRLPRFWSTICVWAMIGHLFNTDFKT